MSCLCLSANWNTNRTMKYIEFKSEGYTCKWSVIFSAFLRISCSNWPRRRSNLWNAKMASQTSEARPSWPQAAGKWAEVRESIRQVRGEWTAPAGNLLWWRKLRCIYFCVWQNKRSQNYNTTGLLEKIKIGRENFYVNKRLFDLFLNHSVEPMNNITEMVITE